MTRHSNNKLLLKYFLALQFLTHFSHGIKVLESQLPMSQDGKAISGAKLEDDRKVEIEDITLCIRFNFKLLGGYEGRSRLITIEDWKYGPGDGNFSLLYFGAEYPVSFFGFGYPRSRNSYRSYLLVDPDSQDFEIWASNRWTHVCMSYEKSKGRVRVVKDGKLLNLNQEDPNFRDVAIPQDFLSKIYIGRCSFDYKKTCSAPEGLLSDFNIWDRSLTIEEQVEWTSCKNMVKGNLVNWDTASFDLVNMTAIDISVESICVPQRPGHVLLPQQRNLTSHGLLCEKMRGITSVVRDNETQTSLIDYISGFKDSCSSIDAADLNFWAGWWDQKNEGTFADYNTNEPLGENDFQPWYYGEPNGNSLENCAVIWSNRESWNDEICSKTMCGFCELERDPDIQIRGLCHDSKFDTKYSWTKQLINNRHSFRGYKDTFLSYNDSLQLWKLELYSTEKTFATCNSTDYPFGTNWWVFSNEDCYEEAKIEIELNMNACHETEFNCGDGNCIQIEQRCNGKIDCIDRTDEMECDLFTTDSTYLKEMAPEPLSDDDRTDVLITVDVLSILDISEVDNFISLQLRLALSWKDTRLTMYNLNEASDLNTLTIEARQRIWIPQVIFYNTKLKEESLNDEKAIVTIKRVGSYQLPPKSSIHNSYVFKGSENPLIISRVYSFLFSCDFDMRVYPFDTQSCSATFVLKGNTGKFAKLKIDDMNYLGPIDLTQYFVQKTEFSEVSLPGNATGVQINLIFGRRILSTILTTYLPTTLICIVSFSTNYFKGFFFEAIVTVNLTSLLVLTTLFISVSNSLPQTAYMKLIDIWLIFNLFVPFSEVILQTIIESLREDDEINHHGKSLQVGKSSKVDPGLFKPELKMINNAKMIKVATVGGKMDGKEENEGVNYDDCHKVPMRKNSDRTKLRICKKLANRGLPTIFILFSVFYFTIGFLYYKRVISSLS